MSEQRARVTDHEFQPSARNDSCDRGYWQARGPRFVCGRSRAAHEPDGTDEEIIDVLLPQGGETRIRVLQAACDDYRTELAALTADLDRANEHNRNLMTEVNQQSAEITKLRETLAEVMVPIEALAAHGDDAWELAPEVRGELMTARTIGRAVFDKDQAQGEIDA